MSVITGCSAAADALVACLQYVKQVKDVLREVGELTAARPEVLDISQSPASGSRDAPAQPAPNGQPPAVDVSVPDAALARLTLAEGSSNAGAAQQPCSNGSLGAPAAAAPLRRSTAAEAAQAGAPGQDSAAAEGGEGCGEEQDGCGDFEADELTRPERDIAMAAQQVGVRQSC